MDGLEQAKVKPDAVFQISLILELSKVTMAILEV